VFVCFGLRPVGLGKSGLQDDAVAMPAAFSELVCLGRFGEWDGLGDA
jgi:hypothetical protein